MDHIGEKQVIIGGKSNNSGEILEVADFLGSAPAIERSLGFWDG